MPLDRDRARPWRSEAENIWHRVGQVAEGGAGTIGAFLGRAGGFVVGIGDPDTRRRVAFSMALIALAAKMAKADGVVTADEEAAFQRLFEVPPSEARNVRRLFDLAKRDVAGFDAYARQIARLYSKDASVLEDVLDGLFMIAKADGAVHEAELAYLEDVALILGVLEADFERVVARHVVPEEGDPYLVLESDRDWPLSEIRTQFRRLVADNHPDRLIGRGMPEEFIAIANDRLAAINAAWERVKKERAPRPVSG